MGISNFLKTKNSKVENSRGSNSKYTKIDFEKPGKNLKDESRKSERNNLKRVLLSEIRKVFFSTKDDLDNIISGLKSLQPLLIRVEHEKEAEIQRTSDLLLGVSMALDLDFIEVEIGLYIIKPSNINIDYNG